MTIRMALFGAALIATAVTNAHASGFATYFALVSAAGKVATSSGVASASKVATGSYLVTFSRSIKGCGFVAMIKGSSAGLATANYDAGHQANMTVNTFSPSGAAANLPFNVIVSCAP